MQQYFLCGEIVNRYMLIVEYNNNQCIFKSKLIQEPQAATAHHVTVGVEGEPA